MQSSYWGYWLVLFGTMIIGLMISVNAITSTSTQDHYSVKEMTEAAMLESVDYGYYRDYNELKINKEAFMEVFIRMMAENMGTNNTYRVNFYDIYEAPPKVSVEVKSHSGTNFISSDDYDVTTRVDAILQIQEQDKNREYDYSYYDKHEGGANGGGNNGGSSGSKQSCTLQYDLGYDGDDNKVLKIIDAGTQTEVTNGVLKRGHSYAVKYKYAVIGRNEEIVTAPYSCIIDKIGIRTNKVVSINGEYTDVSTIDDFTTVFTKVNERKENEDTAAITIPENYDSSSLTISMEICGTYDEACENSKSMTFRVE